jgi:transporter family-2 protein
VGGLLPIVIVIVAGLGLAIQPPTNAALARASGSVWLAALVSFTIGTAALLVVWAFDRTPVSALRGAPWWAWLGGLYGAAFVAALAFAAPRLGIAAALSIAVASQLVAALTLDQFGLLQLPQQPVTLTRLAGLALVLVGVVVFRRG